MSSQCLFYWRWAELRWSCLLVVSLLGRQVIPYWSCGKFISDSVVGTCWKGSGIVPTSCPKYPVFVPIFIFVWHVCGVLWCRGLETIRLKGPADNSVIFAIWTLPAARTVRRKPHLHDTDFWYGTSKFWYADPQLQVRHLAFLSCKCKLYRPAYLKF